MARYSEEFKLAVVRDYLGGRDGGLRQISSRYSIDEATVRKWVAAYRAQGPDGLKKKFERYTAEFKVAVIRRIRKENLSHREAAALYDIRSRHSIATWERLYDEGGPTALRPRKKPRRMQEEELLPRALPPRDDSSLSRAELVKELNHLRMELAYLKKLNALVQATDGQVPPSERA